MQQIQQSEATAAQRRIFFQLVDSGDGIAAETGVTGTGFLSKNGAAPVATSASLVELSATNMPGRYHLELTAAEVNTLGILVLRFKSAATAEMVASAQIVPFDPYDATRMGLTALPNANAEAAGGLYTRGSGTGQINQATNGQIDTNPVALNNVAQSLLDLKDFADEGYNPATNKVTGLLLADTVTAVTNDVNAILANSTAHGGVAAVLTLERLVIASTTAGQPGITPAGTTAQHQSLSIAQARWQAGIGLD